MAVKLPSVPYPGFPLRPHANGQWYKSVWNSRTQRTEHFYFGPWREDPQGERALNDPQSGWLARRTGIKAGTDNVRVQMVQSVLTLGELMGRFLVFKRGLVLAGDLSARTLGDYIREIEDFVAFLKPATPIGALKPEHFTAYMHYMVEGRKLGRHGPSRWQRRSHLRSRRGKLEAGERGRHSCTPRALASG